MTKKEKLKLSLLDLEIQSMELENILQQPVSINLKRLVFLSFFNMLADQKDQAPFRSYYLQFENYVPKMCENIIEASCEPKQILQLKRIINNFSEFASTAQMGRTLAAINIRLIAAVALSYFYVGEPLQTMLLLGLESLEKDPFREGMSEIEKALKLYQVANDKTNLILKRIEPQVKNWQNSACQFSGDSINILMVDDFSNYEKPIESEGKIVTLSGVVRERPMDVEDDRIILNNRAQLEQGSLYYSLLDGLTAGKQITGLPGAVSNRHYSFQFSISEKDAELFGNSVGAGAGLLVYTLILNRYHRAQVAGIGSSTAITGCIQQNGEITPVDSLALKGKLKAAFFSPLTRVVVPDKNLEEVVHYVKTLKEEFPNRHLAVEGISSLAHLIEDRNVVKVIKIKNRHKLVSLIRRRPRNILIPISFVLILILLAMLFIKPLQWWRDTNPVELVINDRIISVQNKSGEFLWSYEFNNNLNPQRYMNTPDNKQKKIFLNIDNDKRNELLLGTYDTSNPGFSGRLYFFSSDGDTNWTYKAGRLMKFGCDYFSDFYKVESILVEKFFNDCENQILINVAHWPYFPSNLTLLNSRKKVLGEYWNSGRFNCFDFYDINHDGKREIFAGGMNNEGKVAFLVILDPVNMWGSSPQNKDGNYYTKNVPTGTEKYYIRFPKSPFNYAKQGDTTYDIMCYKDYFVVVIGNHNMYEIKKPFSACNMYRYQFDYDLNLIDLSFNDPFAIQYFYKFGKEIGESEKEKLKRIKYWDGEEWVEKATMNKIWKNVNK